MSLEQLEEILNSGKIKEKDLEIVKTRYGYYNDNKPLFMQEVADIFGYSSKQTISDAEERTMKKLREIKKIFIYLMGIIHLNNII